MKGEGVFECYGPDRYFECNLEGCDYCITAQVTQVDPVTGSNVQVDTTVCGVCGPEFVLTPNENRNFWFCLPIDAGVDYCPEGEW